MLNLNLKLKDLLMKQQMYMKIFSMIINVFWTKHIIQGPLLLTRINFNPKMDM